MSIDDTALHAEVRRGNTTALAQLIELRRPHLLAFIERQLGAALRRKVEVDDVFQETAAEAVRALPGADLKDREPFSWLCQIAERRIIDLHRKFFDAQKRDAAREVPLAAPAGGESHSGGLINMLVASMTTASQAFSRNVREAKLMDAIATLPEDQRDALRLRYIENLPSKEIAKKLGKSDAAVRVMLTRSLKKLQTILEEAGGI